MGWLEDLWNYFFGEEDSGLNVYADIREGSSYRRTKNQVVTISNLKPDFFKSIYSSYETRYGKIVYTYDQQAQRLYIAAEYAGRYAGSNVIYSLTSDAGIENGREFRLIRKEKRDRILSVSYSWPLNSKPLDVALTMAEPNKSLTVGNRNKNVVIIQFTFLKKGYRDE